MQRAEQLLERKKDYTSKDFVMELQANRIEDQERSSTLNSGQGPGAVEAAKAEEVVKAVKTAAKPFEKGDAVWIYPLEENGCRVSPCG